jgi:hypothetical protein
MIEKLNILIQNKDTKKIEYNLWLDEGYWTKSEYNSRGNEIYFKNSRGYSANTIYFKNSSNGYKYKR